mmetsp:Transcript_100370/g.287226  ORF Transcript_100370/g.287226 Transcript_100370/m.287226 type:complete len:205 (+) Transcript_100370:97-711(+)
MQRLKGVANGASTEMAGALETAHTESKKSSEALQGDRSEIEVKGVGNLEAMYSLAFTFAFAGTVPSTFYAASVYWDEDTTYYGVEVNVTLENKWVAYCPTSTFAEPFAATANLCYWFAGLGLFLLPFFSGDHMPPKTFGVGMLVSFLGAASMAFHAAASTPGNWRHAADRFGMYMVFGYLAVAVLHSLFQACIGQPTVSDVSTA